MRKIVCVFMILLPFIMATHVSGQSRLVNRKIEPVSGQVISDTVPRNTRPVKSKAKLNNPVLSEKEGFSGHGIMKNLNMNMSNLYLINRHLTSDPEVKPPVWSTQYTDDEIIYDADMRNAPNWQYDFIWTNIPTSATQARFVISSQPFPPNDVFSTGVKETRIIQKLKTRTIGKKQEDTVRFNISFKEQPLKFKPKIFDVSTKTDDGNNYKKMDRSVVNQVNRVSRVNATANVNKNFTQNTSYTSLLSEQASYGYYFVRIIALDAAGKPVGRISNTIKIIPRFYEFKEPVPSSEDSLQSDYEITSINYVQMHEPEQQFVNCTVVTGLDPNLPEDLRKIFPPVGSTICPSPPEKPSTFEKISGAVSDAGEFVLDAAKTIINGASTVYSETKGYLKNKFGELLCNYNPVVSSLKETGLNKQAVDEGCQTVAGATFDAAMSYAGMPPSIPNFDEMCKMAKGQVVELMIQKAAEASGMPCDEACKQLIMKAYDKVVSENAEKNVVTQNGVSFKPDPRGQYRLPYVEIEIARKRQTQKGAPIITSLYFTPRVEKYFKDLYDKDNRKNYSVNIKTDKLYQRVMMPIPYLKNVGDKIKLIVVLTPKRSYFSYRCPNGAIDGIENYQQHCEGLNVMQTEMGEPRFSLGYSGMVDNATITIKPEGKIALAPGVQTTFVHHQ